MDGLGAFDQAAEATDRLKELAKNAGASTSVTSILDQVSSLALGSAAALDHINNVRARARKGLEMVQSAPDKLSDAAASTAKRLTGKFTTNPLPPARPAAAAASDSDPERGLISENDAFEDDESTAADRSIVQAEATIDPRFEDEFADGLGDLIDSPTKISSTVEKAGDVALSGAADAAELGSAAASAAADVASDGLLLPITAGLGVLTGSAGIIGDIRKALAPPAPKPTPTANAFEPGAVQQ